MFHVEKIVGLGVRINQNECLVSFCFVPENLPVLNVAYHHVLKIKFDNIEG